MLVRASKHTADILQLSAHSSKVLEENTEKLDAVLQEVATDLEAISVGHAHMVRGPSNEPLIAY